MSTETSEKRLPITTLIKPEAKRWVTELRRSSGVRYDADVLRACMTVARRHQAELDKVLEGIRENQ